ncbi:MAG TPA: hypothetical protein ACFYD6_13445 [Candidatus Brocadiia bacterium]|nr:hypothetical protein [Candidatus Brocadiales bacterium]
MFRESEEKSPNREVFERLIDRKREELISSWGKSILHILLPDGCYTATDSFSGKLICKLDAVSPDCKRVAHSYRVKGWLGNKEVVVIDGKEGKKYLGVSTPIFSPNSTRVVYEAEVGTNKWVVVVDGKEEKKYKGITEGSLTFSPDGKRIAYEALLRGAGFLSSKTCVVVDGKEGKPCIVSIVEGIIKFSPDSNRVAYVAHKGPGHVVMVDGKKRKI